MSNYNITFTTDPGIPLTNVLDNSGLVTELSDPSVSIVWDGVTRATSTPVSTDFGFTGGSMYAADMNLRRPAIGQLYPR